MFCWKSLEVCNVPSGNLVQDGGDNERARRKWSRFRGPAFVDSTPERKRRASKFVHPKLAPAVRIVGYDCFRQELRFPDGDYVASSSEEEHGAEGAQHQGAGVVPPSPAPAPAPRPPRAPQRLVTSPGPVMLFPLSPTSGTTTSTASSTAAKTAEEKPQGNSTTVDVLQQLPFLYKHGPVPPESSDGDSSSVTATL